MKKILVILAMLVAMNVNAQWVSVPVTPDGNIRCFGVSGTKIFVGLYNYVNTGGVFSSTNNGLNWIDANIGLNSRNIFALEVSGSNIFAGTSPTDTNIYGGVYLSTNDGISWTARSNGLTNRSVLSLAASGSNLFAGTWQGVFLTTNNGLNWTSVSNGLINTGIYSLAVSGSNIFAGTYDHGVYLSTNNGNSWTAVNNGITHLYITGLVVSGSNIFASAGLFVNDKSTTGAIFRTTNNGANWVNVNNGLPNTKVFSLAVSDTYIFSALHYNGFFVSTNNGANWINKNDGLGGNGMIEAILIANNYAFAGFFLGNIYRRSLSEIIGIQNISTEVPSKYSLSQNYPNPFNSTSNLKFQIVNTGDVKLIVYDIMGKEVQTLVNERLQPGTYEAAFDASSLNTGVYFYKLVTNGFTETKKMLLIK